MPRPLNLWYEQLSYHKILPCVCNLSTRIFIGRSFWLSTCIQHPASDSRLAEIFWPRGLSKGGSGRPGNSFFSFAQRTIRSAIDLFSKNYRISNRDRLVMTQEVGRVATRHSPACTRVCLVSRRVLGGSKSTSPSRESLGKPRIGIRMLDASARPK